MTADLTPAGRIEAAKRELPFAVQRLTQFIVDNPVPVMVVGAGALVLGMAARNVCKPRGLVENVALLIVLDAVAAYGATEIVKRGWLSLKVRDEDGNLVPLKAGE